MIGLSYGEETMTTR